MKPKIISLLISFIFLASCAPQTPPLPPVGEGTGVRSTPHVTPDTSHVRLDTLTPDTLTLDTSPGGCIICN